MRKLKPLHRHDLAVTVLMQMANETLTERVRRKIGGEMKRQRLSQRNMAKLNRWSQAHISRLLSGKIAMNLDDLEGLCFAVGLSIVEAVRQEGYEFCAEMAPTELAVLDAYRDRPQEVKEAIQTILDVRLRSRALKPPALKVRKRRVAQ